MEILLTKSGLKITGELIFKTLLEAERSAKQLFDEHRSTLISIDCKNLTKLDSAGIALLVEWKRWCDNHQKKFQIVNTNEKAIALISSYKLSSILNVVN